MVDADQRGQVLGQPLYQPFGDALPGPVFARAMAAAGISTGACLALGQIDAQAL